MGAGIRVTGITAGDEPIALGNVEHAFLSADAGASGGTETLTLTLDDLIPDAHNEIVILDASGHDIAVVTPDAIAAQGVADAHVTATGLDVSGFAYCTFDGGVTVFYPSTHRLIVTNDA
ncbi:MAG: hypothetical protein KGL11_10325 [Alphaproteobacteria bacterium]|nr:hypothetical protein [Alphaproteobacteria bacterium]